MLSFKLAQCVQMFYSVFIKGEYEAFFLYFREVEQIE